MGKVLYLHLIILAGYAIYSAKFTALNPRYVSPEPPLLCSLKSRAFPSLALGSASAVNVYWLILLFLLPADNHVVELGTISALDLCFQ